MIWLLHKINGVLGEPAFSSSFFFLFSFEKTSPFLYIQLVSGYRFTNRSSTGHQTFNKIM
jgi:hypothetical protein